MRVLLALVAAGLVAGTSPAAKPSYLDQLLKGKVAGSPERCILPDFSAKPVIIDGQAIVYRRAGTTYVAHFKGGCPQLREDRRIGTRTSAGRLCENDPVRVTEATGHDFGFCTFDKFTPYTGG